jgi:hypothetical protein
METLRFQGFETRNFSLGAAIDLLLDLLQHMSGDALDFVLGVERQHPDLSLSRPQVVDDPNSAALAAAGKASAKLADPARPANHVASVWVVRQRLLQRGVFVV